MVVGGSDADARKGETEGGGGAKAMAEKQVRHCHMDRKAGTWRYLGNREGLSRRPRASPRSSASSRPLLEDHFDSSSHHPDRLMDALRIELKIKRKRNIRRSFPSTDDRKKKEVYKTTTTDDKRLQSTLKRVGVNTIPGVEEANIYKVDIVIQFQNPTVQASPHALTSQTITSPSVGVKTWAAPVWCKSSSSPGGVTPSALMAQLRMHDDHGI
ncbi:hypothetical protein VPH35_059960 [Triticum aestivum]|uniref:Nascent polypeptide-associated complex subunit beta n=1 Tax=Aegilops tauschii TaxID=37682 RepID=M8BUT1_AEGTA